MQDAKEEVRAKLNIEDVIGEYVSLKRAGRNFKGLSPFTGEKSASFFVSPDKHIWHDFSSNKGGDVFSFVMEVEGMDFRQSLEYLAKKAGVDLSQYESAGSRDLAKRKKRLLLACDMAATYYQHCLLKNQHALEYVFHVRALSKQIVSNFRIGYAPDSGDALVQFLTKKGFTRKELSDSGLTNRYGGDMFRGRMTVPLMDGTGQVIGFTARTITADPDAPKYLNTPQTLLYDKGRHVFGLHLAKEAIRANDYAVIVEGNLDVVSSHQAGVMQVVATAGTAMTENHLRALRRLTGNVRLAFDSDKAGIAATERAIPIASEVAIDLKIISLPEGAKDPDDLIQQGVGLWQQAIIAAQPAVDWVLAQYTHRQDLTTAAGKRSFTTAGLAVVRHLQDPVEQEHYIEKIASIIGSSRDAVMEKFHQSESTNRQKPLRRISQISNGSATFDHIDTVLGLALINPSLRDLFNQFDPETFGDECRKEIVHFLTTNQSAVQDTPKELQSFDEYVKIVLLRAEKRYSSWTESDQYFETAKLLRQYKTEHDKKVLEQQIINAEASGDESEANRLRERHYKLIKEIKRAQRSSLTNR